MNSVELIVYNLVKNNPQLKHKIVDAYQAALSFVPQKSIKSDFPLSERQGFFYGFHDKCPFSSDGQLLLGHRNLIGNRTVQAGDEVEVGVFHGPDWTRFKALGRTTGWNWQLGSMLQWHGRSSDFLVYNTVRDGAAIAVVSSVEGQERMAYPWPIVHVSPDGKFACSYDFGRVELAMPGYGIVFPLEARVRDGAFRIFSTDGIRETFALSLAEASSLARHPSMDGAFAFFHHSLFNPSGTRLFFLFRWLDRNRRLWTRMFSVDVDGSDLYLFPMDEMVSHIGWASDTSIFAYLRYPGQGDGYYLVDDFTGAANRYFAGTMNSDGHPQIDFRRDIVLTDSYPDRFRNQHLILLRISSGQRIDLCRTHLPIRFKRELQVDLHPRLHPLMNVACFDSGHSGTRSLMTLDFSGAFS